MTKIFCPECEAETEGVLESTETDADGYTVETYQCYTCFEIFDCIYPPKLPPNTYMLFCDGCGKAVYFTLPERATRATCTVTCDCGKVSDYDTANMKPVERGIR